MSSFLIRTFPRKKNNKLLENIKNAYDYKPINILLNDSAITTILNIQIHK